MTPGAGHYTNDLWKVSLVLVVLLVCGVASAAVGPRQDNLLDAGWRSVVVGTNSDAGFERPGLDDRSWHAVEVPHNWDDYGGEHRLVHGNLHGTAWYRREFFVREPEPGGRVFLFFEGVGSYAMVWVNGKAAGHHAGGRTTFTLDVSGLVEFGKTNLLAVRADHPAEIRDLPWVCGGCSTATGFSEGSQPLGIFRPVHLVTTGAARVEPFGVHVWNDANATSNAAVLHVETEIRNYGSAPRSLVLETRVKNRAGQVVADVKDTSTVAPNETVTLHQDTPALTGVELWSVQSPNLYTIESTVHDGTLTLDRVETPFGIRVIRWPSLTATNDGQFTLNGRPVFINGTCEYEHLLGASHAFGAEQIRARVAQIEAAGFNAVRDAHQPHNLRYQEFWDRDGILWWPQFSAHIWFDTSEFRANFKTLLREWVRERRNSPSVVLWGLQNESKLPEDFARECVDLIRQLDPTASSQRLITTCNGGLGSDWNVPQNWTGTYGGDPAKYAGDLRRSKLIGEYGAWRSLGLHTEGGYVKDGPLSEDRLDALMELKVRLAESVRDESCGQFQWLIATHDNPGRKIGKQDIQGADAVGALNGVGPANNKGLLTLWGEPTDAYYLYRANYASPKTDPMLVIVSHTWPERWTGPGVKTNIEVYSNCEEVELFNDVRNDSLGRQRRGGPGTHFHWDNVNVRCNVLYAEGRVGGKVVATDAIVLKNLPEAPHRAELNGRDKNLTAPEPRMNYLCRVNCGGPDYTDKNGSRWMADRDYAPGDNWGSLSWAQEFGDVPARFGSQRETYDAIIGTRDEALFQTYRFGRGKLRYRFAVPDGEYQIELYFAEPWYGRGGGNCAGWRLFDVAVNGETKIRDLDLWRESGYAVAVKKVVSARARDGWLEISFPRVAAYQAVISAIAIATADMRAKIPAARPAATVKVPSKTIGTGSNGTESAAQVYPATAGILSGAVLENNYALLSRADSSISWKIESGLGGAHEVQVNYLNAGATDLPVELKVVSADGTTVDAKRWNLAQNQTWALSGPQGGVGFNAGTYTLTLTLVKPGVLKVQSLSVK